MAATGKIGSQSTGIVQTPATGENIQGQTSSGAEQKPALQNSYRKDQFEQTKNSTLLDHMLYSSESGAAAKSGQGASKSGGAFRAGKKPGASGKLSAEQQGAKEKLEKSAEWGSLSDKQKSSITKDLRKLSGEKLNSFVTKTEEKFQSITTLKGHSEWNSLTGTQREKVADQILKAKDLSRTEGNLKSALDFSQKLSENAAASPATFDRLLKMESKDPKAFQKTTAAMEAAGKFIDSSSDKKTAAKDVRDMLDIAIDRTVGDKHHRNLVEVKTEAFNRLFNQYQKDPADFAKTRELLKDTPGTLQLNLSKKDMLGMNVKGGAAVSDDTFTKLFDSKGIPADQQEKYKGAMKVLLQNEGKPDAVNTYDSGIVSTGMRQWTSHRGSLTPLLKDFQKAHPEKFKELLPGVEIGKANGKEAILFNGKSLTLTSKKESSSELIGKFSQSEIVDFTKQFAALSKDPDFQAIQLSGAADRITTIRNMSVGSNKIDDYMKTPRAFGHIVDYDANRPAYVQPSFKEAVKETGNQFGLSSESPTRQELMDGLKAKVEGDKDYQKKLDEKYGKGTADGLLKGEEARGKFVEDRLAESFRDHFLPRVRKEKNGAKRASDLVDRFKKTDRYYNSAEKAASLKTPAIPTTPAELLLQNGKQIQIGR